MGRKPKRWRRRFFWGIGVYIFLWVTTWIWGSYTIDRHFRNLYRNRKLRNGTWAEYHHFRNVSFKGSEFNYWPDPLPQESPWCCLGTPWSPCPFIIVFESAAECGVARKAYCFWLPRYLALISEKKEWVIDCF